MNCKRFEKLLYLYRPGELTPSELDELNDHLMICQSCKKKRLQLEQEPEFILRARQSLPENPSAFIFAAEFIHKPVPPKQPWSVEVMASLARPRVRLALVGALCLIVLSFFIQEYYILSRIVQLENRLALQSRENALYILSLNEIKNILDPMFLNNADISSFRIPNDYIVISRQTLQSLLKLSENKEQFEQYLNKKNPHGLNKRKLDLFWRQRNKLLKFYQHLL